MKIKGSNKNYFVYADRMLGVEVNDSYFRWVYGRNAPAVDKATFDACKVRFFITFADDHQIQLPTSDVERFQCFSWNRENKTLCYHRKLLGAHIAYSVSIRGNEASIILGRFYANLMHHRFMNLHGAYYLLSDLANILLLKNGYVTLYCAAALHRESGRRVALFSAPNTGKSYTVQRLCETGDYSIIAEDIAIADEEGRITGCPWTNSYRKGALRKWFDLDSGGTFAHRHMHNYTLEDKTASGQSYLSDVILLSRMQDKHKADQGEIEKKILILNKYLFCGYNSPIVNVLAFFDDEFNCDWECTEKQILLSIFSRSVVTEISLDSGDFFPLVKNQIESGNM